MYKIIIHIIHFIYDLIPKRFKLKDISVKINDYDVYQRLDIGFRSKTQTPILMVVILDVDGRTEEIMHGKCYFSLW